MRRNSFNAEAKTPPRVQARPLSEFAKTVEPPFERRQLLRPLRDVPDPQLGTQRLSAHLLGGTIGSLSATCTRDMTNFIIQAQRHQPDDTPKAPKATINTNLTFSFPSAACMRAICSLGCHYPASLRVNWENSGSRQSTRESLSMLRTNLTARPDVESTAQD